MTRHRAIRPDGLPSRPSPRRIAALALAALILTLPACGSEDEPASEPTQATAPASEPTGGDAAGEVTAEPPPETVPAEPDSSSRASEEVAESRVVDDSETAPVPCPDVVIEPDSDNGLFDVEAADITCDDAATALRAWGEAGFPGDEPPGFDCEDVTAADAASTRLRCSHEASGGTVEFDTGL